MQESNFPTEESRRKLIKDSFKIDENEILNRDAKLKEEVIKLFSTLALHQNHYSKTALLELRIELQPEIQGEAIEPRSACKLEGTIG